MSPEGHGMRKLSDKVSRCAGDPMFPRAAMGDCSTAKGAAQRFPAMPMVAPCGTFAGDMYTPKSGGIMGSGDKV